MAAALRAALSLYTSLQQRAGEGREEWREEAVRA
jgi:hypothetical protein